MVKMLKIVDIFLQRYKKHTNDFIPDIIRKKAKDIFIINLKNRGRIFL